MSFQSILAIVLRLYLILALAALSALAFALGSSYLMGGSAPATILYSFLCVGCGLQPFAAAAVGALLAALALGAGRRGSIRERTADRPSIGTVKPQC